MRDADPGPGTETKVRGINIAERMQSVDCWVNPVVERDIDRALGIRVSHGYVQLGIHRKRFGICALHLSVTLRRGQEHNGSDK